MTVFTADQIEALRDFARLWSPERFAVIGASALACFMDMRWRKTHDLDLALATSLEDLSISLDSLPGWAPDPQIEHRWLAPGDVRVDIVPAGSEALQRGELIWPKSGRRMSLLGFRLAFEQSLPVQFSADLTVRVAPIPVLVVLKIAAYIEAPYERARDLEDIAYALEDFVGSATEERYSDEVIDAGLTYEEVSPFLLGRRIGAIVNDAEKEMVEGFLRVVEEEGGGGGTQARMLVSGPPAWRRDPTTMLRCVRAFRRGFTR